MKYDESNIFNKILKGEIPCDKVYEDEEVLCFKDINPKAPVHVLVIPKSKHISFVDFINNSNKDIVASFFQKVGRIAKKLNLIESGYRIITNHGLDANQEVPHFHIHILGKKKLGDF